jgi:hypothetical protein
VAITSCRLRYTHVLAVSALTFDADARWSCFGDPTRCTILCRVVVSACRVSSCVACRRVVVSSCRRLCSLARSLRLMTDPRHSLLCQSGLCANTQFAFLLHLFVVSSWFDGGDGPVNAAVPLF